MRKLFLLGTMLGVASAALAFGGMFSHGSKSTTYKGGVNAIGVHFGGEKSTDSPVLEPCPEGLEHNTDGSCTVCANGNVYLSYMDDPCGTETPMTGNCKSNKDCESMEGCENGACFCNLGTEGDDWEDWMCSRPNVGSCMALGGKTDIPTDDSKTFVLSEDAFTWWSAVNWCKAQGMQFVEDTEIWDFQTRQRKVDLDEEVEVWASNMWEGGANVVGPSDFNNMCHTEGAHALCK